MRVLFAYLGTQDRNYTAPATARTSSADG